MNSFDKSLHQIMPMFKTANFGENFPPKQQLGWIISGYCMWITSIGQKKLIQLLVPILSGSLGNSHSFQKTAILSLYLSKSLWHYGVDVKCRTSLVFRLFSNSDEINCRPLSVFSPPGNMVLEQICGDVLPGFNRQCCSLHRFGTRNL